MNSRRERNARAALFDGIEEGGIRASSSYSSHEIDEQENDRAVDGLQDRVNLLKRVMSMRRLRLITECWTEWAMTWIVQEEFYPEPWINLRRCLRRNQAAGCLHLLHLLWLFSLLYTILLASKRKWKKEKEPSAASNFLKLKNGWICSEKQSTESVISVFVLIALSLVIIENFSAKGPELSDASCPCVFVL